MLDGVAALVGGNCHCGDVLPTVNRLREVQCPVRGVVVICENTVRLDDGDIRNPVGAQNTLSRHGTRHTVACPILGIAAESALHDTGAD